MNQRLADGLDLHSQIKVAYWNIIAERAVTLGAQAYGTARHAAAHSRLPKYPQDTTRDMGHVKLLADRIEVYLDGLRESRGLAEKNRDTDTVDLFTQVITEFEKHGWFLRASLEG